MTTVNPENVFGVIRRAVPSHGVKVGCHADEIAKGLLLSQANDLADRLQEANPDEEYAVVELVFHRWTKLAGSD